MQQSPEVIDFSEFDDSFFASLENEMDIDVEDIAKQALADILTVKDDDESPDYAAIKQQTENFFANPIIAQDMQLLNSLAMEYARACAGHGHDVANYLNNGPLGDLYKKGSEEISKNKEEDDDIDPKTGKKKKKSLFW